MIELRSKALNLTRKFFLDNGFLEVDTPLIVDEPGLEPYLTPFETTYVPHQGVAGIKYLITSPEFYMKRLICDGSGDIFQLSKCFRNKEDESSLHNPEFTMLEWYRDNANYEDIMIDTENMIKFIVHGLLGGACFTHEGSEINLDGDWPRVSVKEAFLQFAGFDIFKYLKTSDLYNLLKRREYNINPEMSWDDLYFLVFLNEIEPYLGKGKPLFLYDYPISQAALSKIKKDNPLVAERFELYINGVEIANAFSELWDFEEQKMRFEKELKYRVKTLKKHSLPLPNKFLNALKNSGQKNVGGIALGFDRLLMLILGKDNIGDVIYK